MVRPWCVDLELEFWDKHPDKQHIKKLRRKYELFDVENKIKQYFPKPVFNVADVGGGKFGGFLRFYRSKVNGRKYLVDLLALHFTQHLPADAVAIACDFSIMPFVANSIDIMFSQESLDHCLTEQHYNRCVNKIVEVLSPGGLLFYQWPVRKKPIDGHVITRSCGQVIEDFGVLTVLERFKVKKQCYLIMRKDHGQEANTNHSSSS